MKIHKEGYKILRNQIIIILLLGTILMFNFVYLFYILPPLLLIFFFSIFFFRIPNKKIIVKEGNIYAPCDGKIVNIKKVIEDEYYKDSRIQISIFMSPLNVHNQLYPINGEVKYTKYHPGKYFVAFHPKSSILNERSSIVIKNEKISLLSRQIAGYIARRIITYPKVGDKAIACKEYGFIKFGSRIDLFIPINTNIKVNIGDKTISGQSIIGTY